MSAVSTLFQIKSSGLSQGLWEVGGVSTANTGKLREVRKDESA